MAEQLSYVIVTPHSIRKSRTGGIISRLLSRTGLDLVRGRMFAPSDELIHAYAKNIVTDSIPRHRETQEEIRKYVLKHFAAGPDGKRQRALLLVFRGENAVSRVMQAVGNIVNTRTAGETIRDTFGDYITNAAGAVTYFEPAVLAAPDEQTVETDLRLWARYSDSDGGVLDDVIPYPEGSNVEKTLVLIKPDNFRFPSARPGAVIDVFSRTGLYIVGFKVHRMSVGQAAQFYGPVLETLKKVMREPIGAQAKLAIEKDLGFAVPKEAEQQLADLLGPLAGQSRWETIIQFMTGRRPADCPKDLWDEPGSEKCVALVYQGVDAVRKIREVLGPTDPSKAPLGSIRREFGQTVMINAAHASDSPENAKREIGIVDMAENNLKPLVETYYGGL